MKVKFLQLIADSIINGLEKANDIESINRFHDMGMWFDNICVNVFDVYLD